MQNFGINGFGRIGRTATRVWWLYHQSELNLAVINTSGSMDVEDWAHLLQYDSNYGKFPIEIKAEKLRSCKEATPENPEIGYLYLNEKKIIITAQRDPSLLPWAKYGIETVIESTGVFTSQEKASLHLQAGAKRVIISAPATGEGISTGVIGVNVLDAQNPIRSNASCTTNCVAPVTAIIEEFIGIEKAMLTTVHSYTDDQNVHDNSHKDMRRARAAGLNIVPTTTGAAKAVGLVLPSIKGKFDGLAIRVPTPTGSLSDMVFLTKRETSVEEVNELLTQASQSDRWRGILAVTTAPLVSSDIKGRRESSIVDLDLTNVVGDNLVKIVAWYDNEFGYCNRLIEQVFAP